MKPKWLRSKYQFKKEIKRRFVDELTMEYIKILIDEETRVVFGGGSNGKPVGILNAFGGKGGAE